MEVAAIDTLFMFVSDLPRSQQYYTTLLGADPSRAREGLFASYEIAGTNLLLHSDERADWLPAGARKGVGVALHLRVEDISEQWTRLQRLGIDLPEEPQLLHTGIWKFAMKDPDGYEVELIQRPHSALGLQG